MPFEASLTLKKCCGLLVIISICIIWLVSGILHEIDGSKLAKPVKTREFSSVVIGNERKHLHWFIQVTDIHLSVYYDKKRGPDLKRFITDYISVVKPEAVVVTGDLTDAKTKDAQGSHQYIEEWKEYEKILTETKITEKTVWLDIRGNHDAFDVPSLNHTDNLYRKYSHQGKLHPRSYHYLHKTSDGDQISFIGVDTNPNPGLRRPFNFFGIIREHDVREVEKLVAESSNSNSTIFFGHHPTSLIATPPKPTLKDIISQHGVYVCGHLHTFNNIVPNMYASHKAGNLELELGDWKDYRRFRVFAMDHDLFSFTDHNLDSAWPVVLITNPKDARFVMPLHEPTDRMKHSSHIRILVFSPAAIESVIVSIDGKVLGKANAAQSPLYTLPWQPEMYSSGLHSMKVIAKDSSGNERIVEQSISLDNSRIQFGFIPRYILMANHIALGKTIFSLMLVLCVLPLIVLRICRIKVQVSQGGFCGSCLAKYTQIWLRRLYLVAINNRLFYPLVIFAIYVAVGPWFVGEFLDGTYGVCFIYGIYVDGHFMTGTLTYLYGFFQLLCFNLPLTLYLGFCADLAVYQHKQSCTPRSPVLAWLKKHSFFLLIIALQAYLSFTGHYKAYGSVALLVCPIRTWSIFFAIYLRYVALSTSKSSSGSAQYQGAASSPPPPTSHASHSSLSSHTSTGNYEETTSFRSLNNEHGYNERTGGNNVVA